MYFLIGILVILIIIIIVAIVSPLKQRNDYYQQLEEYLKQHFNSYQIKKVNLLYQYEVILNDYTYLIKIVNIPTYAEVQINNYITWEIKYGAGSTPGKAQPYKKYLSDIEGFMKYKPLPNMKKIVVLIPKAKKIVKYINESEIVFVNPNTDVYGVNIINCDDFTIFK